MAITRNTVLLARAFGHRMQEALSRAEFNTVLDHNKMHDDDTCASHDFCDANMVMLAAFIEVMKRNPMDNPAGEISAADTELWNDAWTIAKEAEFYA